MRPKEISFEMIQAALSKLTYDPLTGKLTWKENYSSGARKGTEAGCVNTSGYRVIRLNGTLLLAHRLVWAMQTGKNPPDMLDHCDTDRANNQWGNLREANNSTNGQNKNMTKGHSVGYKGVVYARSGRFEARIWTLGIKQHLGTHAKAEEAALAYNAAAITHFGEFARLNEVPHHV